MTDAFISYAQEDTKFATRLANYLSEHQISTFIDRQIPIGERWADIITTEIQKSRIFLPIVSTRSMKSKWSQTEISMALAAAENSKERIIIPIFLGDEATSLPFLRRYRGIVVNPNDNPKAAFEKILAAIVNRLATQEPESTSEDNRKHNERLLRNALESELERVRLEDAELRIEVEKNSLRQTRFAFTAALISAFVGIVGAALAISPIISDRFSIEANSFVVSVSMFSFLSGALSAGAVPYLLKILENYFKAAEKESDQ